MSNEIRAYPLTWPDSWPRHAPPREESRFERREERYMGRKKHTVNDATSEVLRQLELMGVRDWHVIISTNMRLRRDGLPRSGQAEPWDPGVAVYFKRKGKDMVLALDKYNRVGCNLWGLAKTLEAMRSIERWGGGRVMERTFTGFQRLGSPDDWRTVLSLGPDATLKDARAQYRKLAQTHHPDRGGDAEMLDRVVKAYKQATKELC